MTNMKLGQSRLESFNVLRRDSQMTLSDLSIYFVKENLIYSLRCVGTKYGNREEQEEIKLCKLCILLFLSLAHWLRFTIQRTGIHDTGHTWDHFTLPDPDGDTLYVSQASLTSHPFFSLSPQIPPTLTGGTWEDSPLSDDNWPGAGKEEIIHYYQSVLHRPRWQRMPLRPKRWSWTSMFCKAFPAVMVDT